MALKILIFGKSVGKMEGNFTSSAGFELHWTAELHLAIYTQCMSSPQQVSLLANTEATRGRSTYSKNCNNFPSALSVGDKRPSKLSTSPHVFVQLNYKSKGVAYISKKLD